MIPCLNEVRAMIRRLKKRSDPNERNGAIVLAWCLVAVAPLFVSCEDNVNAIVGTDLPFTVWGFVNAGADTQFVRVFPITQDLLPDVSPGIDARVFSTDLDTGERQEWNYEYIDFDSLIAGHVFWSGFRGEHEHRYRLEVIRSDGATTSAEITVPPEVSFDVQFNGSNTNIPVVIEGSIPNLVGVRVTYNAVNVPPLQAWPVGTVVADPVQLPVTIGYDRVIEKEGDTWTFVIDMTRDFEAVAEVYGLNCLITAESGSAPDVWLRNIEISALAADSSWDPPGGDFDPNALAVPGTFSNVTNGYGFFGAGQANNFLISPSPELNQSAGYGFEPKCPGFSPQPVPECLDPPVPCVGEVLPDLWRIWLR